MAQDFESSSTALQLYAPLCIMDNAQYQDMGSGATFRRTARESTIRANMFAIECAAVLILYWYFLQSYVSWKRCSLLLLFGIVYMARLNIMARWLLPRELAMEELTVVIAWIACILSSISIGAACRGEISFLQFWLALVLYSFGSWLNSWSELQRKWWKAKPENKGRCYTLGLFAWSRNINYFGDVILFAGWAIASDCWWNVWVPVAMGAMFYFCHIPDKEAYLSERYKSEWPGYVSSTKSFIPFVC